MAEVLRVSTGKYKKEGKVEIDGHVWTVKLPGAGTELRLSQVFRASKLYGSRISLLDKKIDNESITEAELDKYEEYSAKFEESEREVYAFFTSMFRDDTKDNSEVKKWIEETPTAIIQMAFEDIKEQSNKEEPDGQQEPSTST